MAETIETLVGISREQLKMLRFLAFRELKRVVEENVKTDRHRLVFEHSDGKSSRDVAAVAGTDQKTVRTLWEKWAPLGIVTESVEQQGRYERLCSLAAIGIAAPSSLGSESPKAQPVAAGPVVQ